MISPVFWPTARILKKHWATSSISSAIASALLSVTGPTPVLRRVDAIVSISLLTVSVSPVDTLVVNI